MKQSFDGVRREYDWDSETCMTEEDWCVNAQGQVWNTEDPDYHYCQWVNEDKFMAKRLGGEQIYSKMMNKLARKPQAKHILASYSADFDLAELESITKPVEDGEREGEKLVEDMLAEWLPKLEEWERAQKQREEQAFEELCEVLLDSVKVDG